ncbi:MULTISPECIES: HdeD family acid-resistance protein [unclassified Gordonia (in: high G+C Gram-positive bacteria)]|uniref:HdeD family acid-resistance protein n=1 Tax=unclassified Gordonia (in: high G+C Gram-positive bacteria) TaxID=2657482 RepID=UPI0020001667|nr:MULTISPECIES: HdeD family acid-resistance protein [unclassified Gordonia (in: high G+C Gram-positive bacteria)]UQE76133.1 HdeD family acid-resistance protein [Gordonia sp. PP30]
MTTNNPVGAAVLGGVSDIVDRTWKSLLGIGIASIVLGIIVLVWPGKTLVVVAVLFGIYLLISGIFQVIATFGVPDADGWWRLLTFVSGTLSVILGVIALRHLGSSLALLAIWIGITWIFRGFSNLSLFAGSPGVPGRVAGIILSIITVIAGIILIVSPLTSIATLALVSGILLVVVGVFEVIDAFSLRSSANNVRDTVSTLRDAESNA